MTEGFVQVNDVKLWYESLGDPDNENVLLISGATRTAMEWDPALLDGLVAAGRHVVRFDNRDIGLSTHVDYETTPYTLDDMATDTLSLLDTLGIQRAHVVGSSLGGMVAQLVALRAQERVLSLTLLITTPGMGDDRLTQSDPRIAATAMRPASTPDEVEQRGRDLASLLVGSRFPYDEARARRREEADRARGTNPDNAHGLVALTAPSRHDALRELTTPTLILHGSEDPLFPADHSQAMAEAIAGSKLVTWEGVGHEIPSQLVPELTQAIVAHTHPRRPDAATAKPTPPSLDR
jgi:pimeloyl-ACP methyl ester carboxylesterase